MKHCPYWNFRRWNGCGVKPTRAIGAKWNIFGGKMEWCHFAPFHFAPQCHFAPTYHGPFCTRDYVWRKRIISTIISPVAQSNDVKMRTTRTWLYLTTCNGSITYFVKAIDVKTRVTWFIKRVKFCFCEILKTSSIASLISMYGAELADDRNQVDVKIDPRQACFFQHTRCSILSPCSILLRLTIYVFDAQDFFI